MNIEEVRSKTDSELDYELGEMRKELFELRFRGSSESVGKPHRIRELKRAVSRVTTVLYERSKGVRGQEPR